MTPARAFVIVLAILMYGWLLDTATGQTVGDRATTELRYCGTPARNLDGSIKRSTTVVNAFRKVHPCPSTLSVMGACPGWSVDHVIPLACGGCDAVSNMQWLPDAIKSNSNDWSKDRWERKVYEVGTIYNGPSCGLQIVK